MDLVNYSRERYEEIKQDFLSAMAGLTLNKVSFIPTSALAGDNVVSRSEKMDWFDGAPLLSFLENVEINAVKSDDKTRFQVQYVIRPQTKELHDYRGYAGTLWSGNLTVGDEVRILPGEAKSHILKIEHNLNEVNTVREGQPIVIQLEDDID
ncbi:hypothetical protein ANCCEY_15536, partial [Ancylostoma ceylanicum]